MAGAGRVAALAHGLQGAPALPREKRATRSAGRVGTGGNSEALLHRLNLLAARGR